MLKKKLGAEGIEINWFYAIDNLEDYFKIPTTLIIPEDCERIGDHAFIECENLGEVIFPEKCVEMIGYASFAGCIGLKKIEIPESVKYIAGDAFKDCYNAEIILRKQWSEFNGIGWNAFKSCRSVKEEIRS